MWCRIPKLCSVVVRLRFGASMRNAFFTVLTLFQLLAPASVASDESLRVPDRYSTLGLERLPGIYNFEYKNFSDGDRQSVIIRSKDQGSFLLVLDRPMHPRNQDIGRLSRYIIPGKSRLHISNGEGLVPRDVIAVYRLRDRAHEKAMVKYLRAND